MLTLGGSFVGFIIVLVLMLTVLPATVPGIIIFVGACFGAFGGGMVGSALGI